MRVTYRSKDTRLYWHERWENISADESAKNSDTYPLKYAEMTITSDSGRILEAGCGAGRILRFYKGRGRSIVGMDYIRNAPRKLKEADRELLLNVGDIRNACYRDNCFKYVLAFGLYHNMPILNLEQALTETFRLLESGGKLCASFRADNIQNYFIDIKKEQSEKLKLKGKGCKAQFDCFHKLNLNRSELVQQFNRAGFDIEKVIPVENMPLLYHFPVFRATEQKRFSESLGRQKGYKLSPVGKAIQKILFTFFPKSFCNIFVIIAKKP